MDSGQEYPGQSVAPPGFGQRSEAPSTAVYPPASAGHRPGAPHPDRPSRTRLLPAVAAALVTLAVIVLVLVLFVFSGSSPAQTAASINLTIADLPGWSDGGPLGGGEQVSLVGGASTGQEMTSCLGSAAEDVTGSGSGVANATSHLFQYGSGTELEEVASGVEIATSATAVNEDLATTRALLNNPHALSCFGAYLDKEVVSTESGATVSMSGIQVTSVTPPSTAASGAVGIQMTAQLTGGAESIPLTFDDYGFAVGRDEISLLTWGIYEPVPATFAAGLARLLVSRALSHPH